MRRRVLLLVAAFALLLSVFLTSPSAQALNTCSCDYCDLRPQAFCGGPEGPTTCPAFRHEYC